MPNPNTMKIARLDDLHLVVTNRMDEIVEAIRHYHLSLDKRLNGDVAAHECVRKIEAILGLEWFPGVELRKRESEP